MAEGPKEGGDEGFSFVDKVRLMMYTEQEKEAFLIDKKEKEEKKKGESVPSSTVIEHLRRTNEAQISSTMAAGGHCNVFPLDINELLLITIKRHFYSNFHVLLPIKKISTKLLKR